MNENMIYFDNSSTAFPKAPGVGEAVKEMIEHGAFNINRGSYAKAYEVADQVLDTREKVARLFQAPSSRQVIFTPGITYSLNYVIKGLLKPGDHVLVTGMEHNAVMRPLVQMTEQGVEYDVVPGDKEGNVRVENFARQIQKHTRAVIAIHASNVCGTILPIEEIGELCRRKQLFFIVDAAQSAGSIEVDMGRSQIDFLAFTGHKGLLGPQGVGGFVISEQLNRELEPLIAGGTGSRSDSFLQPDLLPDKYESGTLNLPGIIGLHAALTYLEGTGIRNLQEKKMALTGYFLERIKMIPGARIIGPGGMEKRLAVIAVDFPVQDNALVAFALEQEYGIMTRVGLHCSPLAHRTLGSYPDGAVRFSFSAVNTKAEIDRCIEGLHNII